MRVEETRCYLVEEALLLRCGGCSGGVARVIFAALVFVKEERGVAYLFWCEDGGVVDGACVWRFLIFLQMVRPDVLPVAEVEIW